VKILFVSSYFPWPLDIGGCLRRYHLVEALSRRHRVTLMTFTPEPPSGPGWPACPLRDRCERVIELDGRAYLPRSADRFSVWAPFGQRLRALVSSPLPAVLRYWNSGELASAFRDLRRSERFDAVWVDRSYFAEVARRAGFDRLVVDLDDLQTVFFARELRYGPWYRSKLFHYAEVAKLFLWERSLPRRFWRLVVCKEADRRFFRQAKGKVFVVPNGIAEFPPTPLDNECAGELLFVGQMDRAPNIDAILLFYDSILPAIRRLHAGACLHIVGKDPDPVVTALDDGSRCIVHGRVADLTPRYERAAVVVAPIRQGSGTRLKVLEALGRGKALVATSMAAEGLDLRPGVDLEIADEPETFARACARLLGDPAARRRLGDTGRRRVQERYRWDEIGRMAEQVLVSSPNLPRAEATLAGKP
jgi:glycosyltransferase involved in cell wall biosynthesis